LIPSPAEPYPEVVEDLVRLRLDVAEEAGTVTDDEFDVIVVSDPFSPEAVAELVTNPLSTSAWVTV
jgi:hypothetical protein